MLSNHDFMLFLWCLISKVKKVYKCICFNNEFFVVKRFSSDWKKREFYPHNGIRVNLNTSRFEGNAKALVFHNMVTSNCLVIYIP